MSVGRCKPGKSGATRSVTQSLFTTIEMCCGRKPTPAVLRSLTCSPFVSARLRPARTTSADEENTTSEPLAANVAPKRRGQGMPSSSEIILGIPVLASILGTLLSAESSHCEGKAGAGAREGMKLMSRGKKSQCAKTGVVTRVVWAEPMRSTSLCSFLTSHAIEYPRKALQTKGREIDQLPAVQPAGR